MKKIIITVLYIFSCTTIAYAQQKLNISTAKSSIKWIGEYTFYFGGHEGFINFTEGHFIKTKDKITGGSFTIDMNSIICTDIENPKGKKSLEDHLKDPDFFDVKKYPIAQLVITKVVYTDTTHARIEADLTIKGITKSVNFRAEFNYAKKEMTTRFKIDRRRWEVNYTSTIRDGAISDAIGFEVSIQL